MNEQMVSIMMRERRTLQGGDKARGGDPPDGLRQQRGARAPRSNKMSQRPHSSQPPRSALGGYDGIVYQGSPRRGPADQATAFRSARRLSASGARLSFPRNAPQGGGGGPGGVQYAPVSLSPSKASVMQRRRRHGRSATSLHGAPPPQQHSLLPRPLRHSSRERSGSGDCAARGGAGGRSAAGKGTGAPAPLSALVGGGEAAASCRAAHNAL